MARPRAAAFENVRTTGEARRASSAAKITFGDFEALTSEVDGADGRPDAHDPEIGPPP